MNIKPWFFIIFFIQAGFIHSLFGQQSIEQVRQLPVGSVVTTSGTITSGPEFGQIRYMQDSNAGIAIYSSDLSSTIPGDSILVTGVLSKYRGELQISPVMSFQLLGTGKQVFVLETEFITDIEQFSFESRKVLMTCQGISTCEKELEDGWYMLYDRYGNITRLRIASDHPVAGFPVSGKPVSVEGIWTKFEDQYQLLCQQVVDASEGSCWIIPQGYVTFGQGKVNLHWNDVPVHPAMESYTQIGIDSFEAVFDIPETGADVLVTLLPDVLDTGTIYKVRLVRSYPGVGISFSTPLYFSYASTASAPVEILFNRTVDASYSDGSHPYATGQSAIETDIIGRIDLVVSTLDIAMYNTTRDAIIQAVERAVQRGVQVRYIAEEENSNSALEGPLSFPVLFRNGDGIMHHKFIVADVEDDSNAWVWTGSTNFSTNQLATDPNHAVIIHDQALARNYTKEFNELWGQVPNHSDGRYGDFKINNTAHLFQVDGMLIESYFSPSDETNCHILEALQTADHHVEIGLLLLTKEDLVDELIDLSQLGVDIRLIVEDESSSSEAISRLLQAEIPVAVHDFSSIYHHKYAIIDEGFPDSDPQVISGSHNWTWSADNINDENTLIYHSQSVANIFRQEFEARWKELNPTSVSALFPHKITVFPNPASSYLDLKNPMPYSCTVDMIDIHGRIITKTIIEPDSTSTLHLDDNLSGGIYMLHWTWPDQRVSTQFVVMR